MYSKFPIQRQRTSRATDYQLARVQNAAVFAPLQPSVYNASDAALRGLPIVVDQQATEAFSTYDLACLFANFRLRRNQLVMETLMIAFCMIMRLVLSQTDSVNSRFFNRTVPIHDHTLREDSISTHLKHPPSALPNCRTMV